MATSYKLRPEQVFIKTFDDGRHDSNEGYFVEATRRRPSKIQLVHVEKTEALPQGGWLGIGFW